MLRGGAFTLRRLQTPCLGGVRRLCSSEGASPIPNADGNFHSEAEVKKLFAKWCRQSKRKYPSKEEKLHRFGIFWDNLEWCTRENMKIDNPRYRTNGINCFADLTTDEATRLVCGGRRPEDPAPLWEEPEPWGDDDSPKS